MLVYIDDREDEEFDVNYGYDYGDDEESYEYSQEVDEPSYEYGESDNDYSH